MKKFLSIFFILGFVSLFLLLFVPGCKNQSNTYKLFEFAGEFQTRDIDKAQMETPFPIVTPEYLPKNIKSPPIIKGTLRRYQIDVGFDLNLIEGSFGYGIGAFNNSGDNVVIQITYTGSSSYIIINESRAYIGLGDPELNTGLKYIDILGTKAIMAESYETKGSRCYLSFQKEGLSFVLDSVNIPDSEVVNVAESILAKQLPDIRIGNPENWPWGEAYGRFYTNEIEVAQKETPFRIITPTYVPEIIDQHSPNIEGSLASQRINNIDTVKLLFFSVIVKESTTGLINGKPSHNVLPVILEISEQSVPFSGKLKIEGNVDQTPVPGRNMSIWTQDIGDMQYGGVTFEQAGIHINLSFYDLALDQVIKVLESLLSQTS